MGRAWRPRSAPVIALAGFSLLVLAWIGTNPMSGVPDEFDHELRALSIGRGDLLGDKLPLIEPTPARPVCCAVGNASAISWVQRGARVVQIPTRLDPVGLPCRLVVAAANKVCDVTRVGKTAQEITTMGTIEAAAYVPAAVASRFAWSPLSALYLTRLATAVCALALVGTGLVSLCSRRGHHWRLVGALVALTPATVFVFSSPSPNALEISGAFAFLSGLLAATDPGALERSDRFALFGGACALALSRSLGPGWLFLLGGIAVGVNGTEQLRQRIRANPRASRLGLGLIGSAVLVTVGWEVAVQPHVPFSVQAFVHHLGPARHELGRVSQEIVGVFGAINIAMPAYVYRIWLIALAAFVGLAAFLATTRRQALVLVALAALCVVSPVLIAAAVLRQNGFDIQGRHVLPLMLALPIVAGVVIDRRLGSRSPFIAIGACVFVAAVHFACWTLNVAAYKLGPNGVSPRPAWGVPMLRLAAHRPAWFVIALLGAALVAVAPAVSMRAAER